MHTLIVINDSPFTKVMLDFSSQIINKSGEATIMMVIPSNKKGELQQAKKIIGQAQQTFHNAASREKVRVGHLAREILQETSEGDYDLLVLGSPASQKADWSNPKSFLTQIVEHAPCPTLIIKGLAGPRIRRVLLCDSGSASAGVLRNFTARLVRLLEGLEQITILHVMSQVSAGPGIPGAQLRSDAENLIQTHSPEGDLLEHDVQELTLAGATPVPKVRHGLVVDEILDEAQTGDYDLVIIGAYRPDGWQKFLLDNLERKIVSQIDRSVLIVKPKTPGNP
jgi:nucleotide-binding universal stress UspA family protein